MRTAALLMGLFLTWSTQSLGEVAAGAAKPETMTPRRVSDVTAEEDPFLWLEDVSGDKAISWVRERNATTVAKYEQTPKFQALRGAILKILDSSERIPFIEKHGDFYYNFWRDAKNERGIWRRCTLEEYRKAEPNWEVILDLDQLSKAENENWVWADATLLKPDYTRALISLSRGGADASVTREFDLTSRTFVADGFTRSEAKGSILWINRDTVFINTDFGPGSMTKSGYPRTVKRWKRGQPLSDATTVYEGLADDMYIGAWRDLTTGFERSFVSRTLAFYNDELFWLKDSGEMQKIDAPNSANKSVFKNHLFLELREPWTVGSTTYPAGSLVVADFAKFMAGERELSVLFSPTETTSLAGFSPTRDHVLLNVMEDVKSRVFVLTEKEGQWTRTALEGPSKIGMVQVSAVDAEESNAYWMTSSSYLTPTTLSLGEVGSAPEKLKQLKAQFDATGLETTQHFATSKDGTRVPYFMVAPKNLRLDGKNPTLLYGYGGFEISLTPAYSASVGQAWLTQGGVYVVANIRGGGEYGPRWHQAALKANRLRAYEDFAAVAEDLVKRGVTSSKKLGIMGGSNGGLLVGNMVTLYPNLFSAAVCQVPLLDMKRYHLLLAGASWMAEYGNPDAPGEWDFIRSYSPYQNVSRDVHYPAVFFLTSTRDDRVHPGHARKMMARMESFGKDVTYYENIEGGHGGAANNRQKAFMSALSFAFLTERLFQE